MKHGFTLIELLVSIVILALAVAMVYESFVSVTTTTELARVEAAHLREREFIWRNFQENMSAVYSDASCIVPEFALQGEADTITFCTSLPMPGSTALPGELRGVTYEVVGPQGANAETPTAGFSPDLANAPEAPAYLLVTESPVVHDTTDGVSVDNTQDVGNVRTRQVPIGSITFKYYDSDAQDWVDQWDSVEMQRMPWAIEVLVNLARSPDEEAALGAGAGEPDLDMTFPLSVGAGTKGPFLDLNHILVDPNATNAGGDLFDQSKKKNTKGFS